jgi:D-glycero-D-manno-heptose 1,7-bisphosphate phosphatase
MLEIAPDVRFIDVVLAEAARRQFTDLVLLAGRDADQLKAAYHGRRVREASVSVILAPTSPETIGALRYAEDRLEPVFLLGDGDCLFDINLRALATPLAKGDMARVALRQVPNAGQAVTAAAPGGRCLVRREILAMMQDKESIAQNLFPKLAELGALQSQIFEGYFLDMRMPGAHARAIAELPGRRKRPCAFLDRDGTITQDNGYTYKREDLMLLPGAATAVRRLNEAGYFVIVVTNQSGVARGYFSEADVEAFHQALTHALAETGAYIDGFYHCPYHGDAVIEAYRVDDHPDRKPNPGMVTRALAEWPIDAARSFLIGDSETDGQAAARAGIAFYKVGSGQGLAEAVAAALRSIAAE